MLNLYIGKESLPDGISFIDDPESVFMTVEITGTEFQRRVLREIEGGEFFDNRRFIDRFGGQLYYDNLSSGSKSLLVAEYYKDRVVNCIDCGENALGYITCLKDGNIYLPKRTIEIPVIDINPVYCYGREWNDMNELNSFIR